MTEDDIIRNCAPTLAGLKTGNTFVCSYDSEDALRESLRSVNQKLLPKGVRAVPLRLRENRALIYVFRPEALCSDLADGSACALLKGQGYCTGSCQSCVAHLARRVRSQEEFPHEIGLFLGYPPEDVRGFMENNACGQKCTGCWKVYGDEEAAKRRFDQYKKCTRGYRACREKGASLEKLTVPTRASQLHENGS